MTSAESPDPTSGREAASFGAAYFDVSVYAWQMAEEYEHNALLDALSERGLRIVGQELRIAEIDCARPKYADADRGSVRSGPDTGPISADDLGNEWRIYITGSGLVAGARYDVILHRHPDGRLTTEIKAV